MDAPSLIALGLMILGAIVGMAVPGFVAEIILASKTSLRATARQFISFGMAATLYVGLAIVLWHRGEAQLVRNQAAHWMFYAIMTASGIACAQPVRTWVTKRRGLRN